MSDLTDLRAQIVAARATREAAAERFHSERAALAGVDAEIEALRRVGAVTGSGDALVAVDPTARGKVDRRLQLAVMVDQLEAGWRDLTGAAAELELGWEVLAPPMTLVEELDDRSPILLLPLRVEARFFGTELRVRVYPDDVAIQTHEPALTPAEAAAGQAHWEAEWRAGDYEEGQRAAWRALELDRDPPRAAWVARALTPANPEDRPTAPVPEGAALAPAPAFPAVDLKEDDWTRPPTVRVLPDRFVVTLHRDGSMVRRVVGRRVPDPLPVGPDPLQLEDELQHAGDGSLDMGARLAWMVDFERAEDIGMAMRIGDLTRSDLAAGFDRLTVLGVRFSSDHDDAVSRLEALFEDHHYGAGLSFLPQGVPTNNTGTAASGFDRREDEGDGLFDVEQAGDLFTIETAEHDKSDGQRLADALTIDPTVFQHIRHAGGRDLATAEAANTALFRGTLGYYLEEMLSPAIDLDDIRSIRHFFTNHVRGRGALPAFRVAQQPYGVLLATASSRLQLTPREDVAVGGILDVIERLETVWRSQDVTRVGDGDDGEADILDVLGLHASSVAYHARHMAGPDYLQNLLTYGGAGADYVTRWSELSAEFFFELLRSLGYTITNWEDVPRIVQMFFMRSQRTLTGPAVTAPPLSETKTLPPVSADDENYIAWLLDSTLDEIRRQHFGVDDEGERIQPPRALLYLLLRHALMLEYWDSAMRLHFAHTDLPVGARREIELVNMEDQPNVTRWDYLEAPIPAVSGQAPLRVVLAPRFLPDLVEVAELQEVKDALDELADLPTAALERLLAEHVDLCSYRLDAWKLGFVHRRLLRLRNGGRLRPVPIDSTTGTTHVPLPAALPAALHLGAYGWLEDIKPTPPPQPVPDDDPAIIAVGGLAALPGSGPAVERTDNGGFVHGASLGHAKTAAVLRSGYLTHRDDASSDVLGVDLSSARVRDAVRLLEGTRNGWTLAALLGYRFERGLHDRSPTLDLDQFIHLIRQRYPLTAGKLHDVEAGEDATAGEARQQLDGVALIDAAEGGYDYDVAGLPAAGTDEADAIVAEVDRIKDALDSVGDLGLAESVYQVVQGNFDRAGAILDALSKGGVAPEPEVVRTPRGGIGQIHRVGIAFDATTPAANPWGAVGLTPRARAEARLNGWLGGLIAADPSTVQVNVVFDPDGAAAVQPVRLDQLGLQPLDLLAAAGADLADRTGVTELERRVAAVAREEAAQSDEVPLRIDWMDRTGFGAGGTTFFELLPLLGELRDALGYARPMHAEDFVVPSDDVEESDDPRRVDAGELDGRVTSARGELDAAVGNLATARGAVSSAGDDPPVLPPVGDIDALRGALMLASQFGVPDAVPHVSRDTDLPAARTLLTQAVSVDAILADRLTAADEALVVPVDETPDQRVARLLAVATAVFGRDVTIVPRFTLTDATELLTAAGDSAVLLTGAPPLAIDEWLESVARVRPAVEKYNRARLLGGLLGSPVADPTPVQLPYRADDRWAALPLVAGAEPPGDTASLVVERPANFGTGATFAGLLIDEWMEVIPNANETTGVAFHFDQPSSEPPQALLLAVSPDLTGNWTWDDLEAVLTDTLDEARMRAVEPDHVQDTVFDQFLPAITPPVSNLPATIGLNLVANVMLGATIAAVEGG